MCGSSWSEGWGLILYYLTPLPCLTYSRCLVGVWFLGQWTLWLERVCLSLSRVSFRVSFYRVSLMFPWEHKGNGPRDI